MNKINICLFRQPHEDRRGSDRAALLSGDDTAARALPMPAAPRGKFTPPCFQRLR